MLVRRFRFALLDATSTTMRPAFSNTSVSLKLS